MQNDRVYHPWWMWECYPAGFYGGIDVDRDDALIRYANFLSDLPLFEAGMVGVAVSWPNSCEQFLTNQDINRIAWLGQSAACYTIGLPSKYRAGFKLLSDDGQRRANTCAQRFLERWLHDNAEKNRQLCLALEDVRVS